MEKVPTPDDNRLSGSYRYMKVGRAKAAFKGIIWSSLNSLAPALIGAAVFALASRFLTPGEFGIVAFAGSISTFISAVAPLALGDAIVQHADITEEHLSSVFWLCVLAALAIYTVMIIFVCSAPFIAAEPGLSSFVLVVGARVIFDLIATVPNALLVRAMSFDRLAVRTTIASLVSAVVCIAVLWMGFGAWALALSQLSAAVAASIAAIISAQWRPRWIFSRVALGDLKRFGLFASGDRVITTISVDQLIVGALLGTGSLGLYGFAQRVYQVPSQLFVGVWSSVSFPLLSSLSDDQVKLGKAYVSMTFACSLVSFPVFVGLAAVADDLIRSIFGVQWLDSLWILRGFCVIGLFACIGGLQSALIRSQGRADWWMWYVGINQLLTAVVVLCFCRFGIFAMVGAMVVKTIVYWPVSVIMTTKILKLSPKEYVISFFRPVLATFIMFTFVLFVRRYLHDISPTIRLGTLVALGACAYAAAIICIGGKKLMELSFVLRKPS